MKKPAFIFGALFLLVIAWTTYYALFSGPHYSQVPKSKIPPPVVISISRSNAPLQVVSGAGSVMFVLPDGSLWRWGMNYSAGTPGRTIVPEQVGTDRNWLQVATAGNRVAALRTDNTLWEWGWRGNLGFASTPQQLDSHPEWTSVAANSLHSLALKKDGSLWTWGNSSSTQPGVPPRMNGTNLVQIGTNEDWAALCSGVADSAYLLKKNHTPWFWGQMFISSTSAGSFHSIPVQLSSDTNWVSIVPGFSGPFVRNAAGEIYFLLLAVPPNARASRLSPPLATNMFSDQIALGYTDERKLFTIHSDGTMWEMTLQGGPSILDAITADQKWRRFGNRSDWVSIWGGVGTTLALTRDGTLWMWGADLERVLNFS